MSKSSNPKKAAPKSKQSGGDKKTSFVTVCLAIFAVVGPFAGAFVQDRFDILKTNRELAISYSKAATVSAAEVETVISNLFLTLSDPNGSMSAEEVENLRDALLKLRSDAEQLAIQVGTEDTPFNQYAGAMADLVEAAQRVSGPADAAPLIEAVSAFYFNKRKFDTDIAKRHKPT
jgi:hypothetical protein